MQTDKSFGFEGSDPLLMLESRRIEFRHLTHEIKDLLHNEGLDVKTYRTDELPHFSNMDQEEQEFLLASLRAQVDLMKSMQLKGFDLQRSSRHLLLFFLTRMELHLPPDTVKLLSDRDFVAVYNHVQQMIFLSPNHLAWMSYTLEDLHCRPWYELFKRDEAIEKILMQRAAAIALGKVQATILNSDIPAHVIKEIDTDEARSVVCHSKCYSPISKDGKLAGFLSVNQDRLGVLSAKNN